MINLSGKFNESMLKEAKQVGILYHFTSVKGLSSILTMGGLRAFRQPYISFTRNYSLKGFGGVRIVINGDKLSNKYKITPYLDKVSGIDRHEGENEEIIMYPEGKVLPILNYIKEIEVLNSVWKGGYYFHEEILKNVESNKIPFNIVSTFKRKNK